MSAHTAHIATLIFRLLKGELSAAEQQELDAWKAASASNQQLFERLTDEKNFNEEVQELYTYKQKAWQIISEEIGQPKIIPLYKKPVFRWAVAASILLIISLGSYFAFFNNKTNNPQIANQPNKDIPAPSSNRAMITLADGRIVYLDSASNGTLANQNNVTLTKTSDGKIVYTPSAAVSPSPKGEGRGEVLNTLSNPRGSKVIDMQLADGSHVWLNAGSSITYPVTFIGNNRQVTMTGEAYFSVTHNDKMPFKVTANGLVIEDLGTEFNVNAYTDETNTKTTLINGVVKIGSTTLKPGQQAINEKLAGEVDVEEVIAWRNGLFQFNKTETRAVMRQLEKWYDIEVRYAGAVPDHQFIGQIDRNLSLVKLLNILAKSGLKFKVEEKVLTIL